MRRYWHPIVPAALLEARSVQSVRLLGEDLTLYRDRSGTLGLIGQRCPHRLVDMRFGIPEDEGLRCPYHGWLFDKTGACIETPLEPPHLNFKSKVAIEAYPVQELGGLIWAYLGPLPAPLLPQDDLFVREDGFRQIVGHRLPCNWLQVMDNRADLGHGYYTHGRQGQYIAELAGAPPEYLKRPEALLRPIVEMNGRQAYPKHRYVRNAYGFAKAMLPSDQPDEVGGKGWEEGMNPVLFPYQLVLMPISGDGFPTIKRVYQIGVPIDDTTTWHIYYFCYTFPKEIDPPKQRTVPYVEVPLKDEKGEFILDYITGQDMVTWWAQGEIADRTREHLGYSDSVLIAHRQLLEEQIALVEQGGEPINVFRNPADAYRRDQNLPMVRAMDEGKQPAASVLQDPKRPGAWLDLKVDGDIGRYCPDRDVLEELYSKTIRLWSGKASLEAVSENV